VDKEGKKEVISEGEKGQQPLSTDPGGFLDRGPSRNWSGAERQKGERDVKAYGSGAKEGGGRSGGGKMERMGFAIEEERSRGVKGQIPCSGVELSERQCVEDPQGLGGEDILDMDRGDWRGSDSWGRNRAGRQNSI